MPAEISLSVHYLDCYNILMKRSIFMIYHVAKTAPRQDNLEEICYVAVIPHKIWNVQIFSWEKFTGT